MATGFNALNDVSVTGLVSIDADSVASGIIIAKEIIVDGVNITDLIDQLENEIDTNAANIAQLQTDVAYLQANSAFTNEANVFTQTNTFPEIQNTFYTLIDQTTQNANGVINSNNGNFLYDCNATGGAHEFYNNSTNGQLNTARLDYQSLKLFSDAAASTQPQLQLTNTNNPESSLFFLTRSQSGNYNPANGGQDPIVLAKRILNQDSLVLTTWSQTHSAIFVGPTSIRLGVGSNTTTPTHSIRLQNNDRIYFQSSLFPASTASESLASNDSSDKIPTTAWVQSAIAGSSGFLTSNNVWTGTNSFVNYAPTTPITPSSNNDLCHKSYVDTKTTLSAVQSNNNTWTGTNTFQQTPTCTATLPSIQDSSTKLATTNWVQDVLYAKVPRTVNYEVFCPISSDTSGGVRIDFTHTSSWAKEDFFMLRVRAQINHVNNNTTPYDWNNYATASGEIIVRPYYQPGSSWGTGTNYQYWPTNNGVQFGTTQNFLYTTGDILNGTNNFIAYGSPGSLYLSSRNPSHSSGLTNYPFTYTCFVEYFSVHTATFGAATITLGGENLYTPHINYL